MGTDRFKVTYTILCQEVPICRGFANVANHTLQFECLEYCDADPVCFAATFNSKFVVAVVTPGIRDAHLFSLTFVQQVYYEDRPRRCETSIRAHLTVRKSMPSRMQDMTHIQLCSSHRNCTAS
jgi:hypothetical protein